MNKNIIISWCKKKFEPSNGTFPEPSQNLALGMYPGGGHLPYFQNFSGTFSGIFRTFRRFFRRFWEYFVVYGKLQYLLLKFSSQLSYQPPQDCSQHFQFSDLIAIPDFAAGAMENWGLITYRETSILYDPDETSTVAHEWVAVVVAHELAHQWFGNLVTMKWWNDLWLNEGAASYFEYKGVNHLSPEWSMMDQFILDKIQPALDLDGLASSHPISVKVKDPTEIEAIFDTISYNKGASILYMLESFLGEDVLRSGLNDYLNTHAYGNADTNDFWAVFTKHANHSFDVKVSYFIFWFKYQFNSILTLSISFNNSLSNDLFLDPFLYDSFHYFTVLLNSLLPNYLSKLLTLLGNNGHLDTANWVSSYYHYERGQHNYG